MMFLDMESAGSPIFLFINSPGGKVNAGLAIVDTMNAPVAFRLLFSISETSYVRQSYHTSRRFSGTSHLFAVRQSERLRLSWISPPPPENVPGDATPALSGIPKGTVAGVSEELAVDKEICQMVATDIMIRAHETLRTKVPCHSHPPSPSDPLPGNHEQPACKADEAIRGEAQQSRRLGC
eukprot:750608-Hanusia_phi.AAC.5